MDAAPTLLLLLTIATPPSSPTVLGAEIESVRLNAVLPESAQIPAEIDTIYRLSVQGLQRLELSFLSSPHTRIADLEASLSEQCEQPEALLEVIRDERAPLVRSLELALPEERWSDGVICLRLSYRVEGWMVEGERARLPVGIIEGTGRAESDSAFEATLLVASGSVLRGGFPSELEASSDQPGEYRVVLPTSPAFVQVEVYRGAAPFLTMTRLADVFTVIAILTLLGTAWYRFREMDG